MCNISTVQALYSLTSLKCIHGKSLRIQETDAANATAVSVGYRVYVQTSRMKTYRHLLERNGRNSGFMKTALCVVEVDDNLCSHCLDMQALWKLL